jgi:1-acyl-sn-glycerol-3-phosphate acyltransferase
MPKIEPGSIVITNHPGLLDIVCITRILFSQGNTKLVTTSWEKNWSPRTALTYLIELTVGGLPMYDSGKKFLQVLQRVSDLMDNGYTFLFAPQGKMRAYGQQEEDPFFPGLGFVVKSLEKPVYVFKISGYNDIWPVPKIGWTNATFKQLMPPKTGTVQITATKVLFEDLESKTSVQITEYLEQTLINL